MPCHERDRIARILGCGPIAVRSRPSASGSTPAEFECSHRTHSRLRRHSGRCHGLDDRAGDRAGGGALAPERSGARALRAVGRAAHPARQYLHPVGLRSHAGAANDLAHNRRWSTPTRTDASHPYRCMNGFLGIAQKWLVIPLPDTVTQRLLRYVIQQDPYLIALMVWICFFICIVRPAIEKR